MCLPHNLFSPTIHFKVFAQFLRLSKSPIRGRVSVTKVWAVHKCIALAQLVLDLFHMTNCKHYYYYYYYTHGADKSLARPGRKQARKHFRDARDFNNIKTRAVIKFFILQGKAPKEIHAILTET